MIRSLLLVILGLCACSSPTQKMALSDEQLANLFTDIHVAKAAIQNAPPHIRDSLYEAYFLQICEIHGVDPDTLQHDMDVLTTDPERMEPIYTRVVDSLEQIALRARGKD
ncbi:MAG: DUF4296 domain-containing protein [Saprospiraceae bacterium]|nr:DUF4296 domain-containing protein [Saprospiraceae bacterium]